MELENYKAIVFDLGGTLMEFEGMPLNWSDYYYQGFNKINEHFGLELSDADTVSLFQSTRGKNGMIYTELGHISG